MILDRLRDEERKILKWLLLSEEMEWVGYRHGDVDRFWGLSLKMNDSYRT